MKFTLFNVPFAMERSFLTAEKMKQTLWIGFISLLVIILIGSIVGFIGDVLASAFDVLSLLDQHPVLWLLLILLFVLIIFVMTAYAFHYAFYKKKYKKFEIVNSAGKSVSFLSGYHLKHLLIVLLLNLFYDLLIVAAESGIVGILQIIGWDTESTMHISILIAISISDLLLSLSMIHCFIHSGTYGIKIISKTDETKNTLGQEAIYSQKTEPTA